MTRYLTVFAFASRVQSDGYIPKRKQADRVYHIFCKYLKACGSDGNFHCTFITVVAYGLQDSGFHSVGFCLNDAPNSYVTRSLIPRYIMFRNLVGSTYLPSRYRHC